MEARERRNAVGVEAKPDSAAFERRVEFLEHLANTGRVAESARAAGFKNSMYVNMLRKKDPVFAEAWDMAIQSWKDELEGEAIRRAQDGVKKAIYFQGRHVMDKDDNPAYEVTYSDSLMVHLLKAFIPERHGDKSKVEHTVTGKVGIALIPVKAISLDDFERESLLMHAQQRPLTAPKAEEPKALAGPKTVELARS